jgi:hypothetical protein
MNPFTDAPIILALIVLVPFAIAIYNAYFK